MILYSRYHIIIILSIVSIECFRQTGSIIIRINLYIIGISQLSSHLVDIFNWFRCVAWWFIHTEIVQFKIIILRPAIPFHKRNIVFIHICHDIRNDHIIIFPHKNIIFVSIIRCITIPFIGNRSNVIIMRIIGTASYILYIALIAGKCTLIDHIFRYLLINLIILGNKLFTVCCGITILITWIPYIDMNIIIIRYVRIRNFYIINQINIIIFKIVFHKDVFTHIQSNIISVRILCTKLNTIIMLEFRCHYSQL